MEPYEYFKLPNVIDPDKVLLEDFEIISFTSSEDSDLYTFWHDQFRTGNLVDPYGQPKEQQQKVRPARGAQQQNGPSQAGAQTDASFAASETSSTLTRSPGKSSRRPKPVVAPSSPAVLPASQVAKIKRSIAAATTVPKDYVPRTGPTVPGNGLAVINSLHYNTMPNGKVMAKYKLTKLYNKLTGRQTRRNYVLERQREKKLEEILSKCQLNTWLTYTSLQALHLPGDNVNQLSSIAINNNPRLISIPQSQMNKTMPVQTASKKKKKKTTDTPTQPQPVTNAAPMHFVYIDPNDIVTYSNRICPQQITEYRKRSHLLPMSATSKRSSAASYDVYEIMDVLANSDKTNITITRNANKPAPAGCSIYSHSTNLNTRGIVSTQLHLQARTYLDTVGKFYAQEATHLAEEAERLRNEPPVEDQIRKYIKLEHTYSSPANSPDLDGQTQQTINSRDKIYTETFEESEDLIDQLEEEILSIVRPHESRGDNSNVRPEATAVQ